MSTTNRRQGATIKDMAAALGCTEKAAVSRMTALGYVSTCGRCGGSGRFSFNTMDGDRCFGCNGKGRKLCAITAAMVAEAKARQEAGELAGYFARVQAIAAAKQEIGPLVEEARAIYATIGDAYERAYRAARKGGDLGLVNDALFRAQSMNNSLFHGDELLGTGVPTDSVRSVKERALSGAEDALAAVRKIRERIADLTALRNAAAAHLEEWIASPCERRPAA